MILFFDVFILVDNKIFNHSENIGGKSQRRTDLENQARSNYSYRNQSKLDITKYTLASYSVLPWKKVIIRYEIEDGKRSLDFETYCKELFPLCIIENERSDTAKKYCDAISKYCDDSDLVFFSADNDQPYISPKEFPQNLLPIINKLSSVHASSSVSFVYSHFTEGINSLSRQNMLWGTYCGLTFKKIYEDEICIAVKPSKFVGDSMYILKAKSLKEIFSKAPNRGRVVRMEDTGLNLSRQIEQVLIFPKEELCRHYDSSLHRVRTGQTKDPWIQPLLFIPDGFFEKNIHIRYGYDDRKDGFVSINPLFHSTCTLNPSHPELNILLNDLPLFWKSRISEVDINIEMRDKLDGLKKENLPYYKYNKNPWADHPKYKMFILFIIRDISLFNYKIFVEPYCFLRILFKDKFGETHFYKILKIFVTSIRKNRGI